MSDLAPKTLFVSRDDAGYTRLSIPNPDGEHLPAPDGFWYGSYVRKDVHADALETAQARIVALESKIAEFIDAENHGEPYPPEGER